MSLDAKLDATPFCGVTLWRSDGRGWQANMQAEKGGGWRVGHGATPSAALHALLDNDQPTPEPTGVFD